MHAAILTGARHVSLGRAEGDSVRRILVAQRPPARPVDRLRRASPARRGRRGRESVRAKLRAPRQTTASRRVDSTAGIRRLLSPRRVIPDSLPAEHTGHVRREHRHMADHDHPDRTYHAVPRGEAPAAPRHHHVLAPSAPLKIARRAVIASLHAHLLIAYTQARAAGCLQQAAERGAQPPHGLGYPAPRRQAQASAHRGRVKRHIAGTGFGSAAL